MNALNDFARVDVVEVGEEAGNDGAPVMAEGVDSFSARVAAENSFGACLSPSGLKRSEGASGNAGASTTEFVTGEDLKMFELANAAGGGADAGICDNAELAVAFVVTGNVCSDLDALPGCSETVEVVNGLE